MNWPNYIRNIMAYIITQEDLNTYCREAAGQKTPFPDSEFLKEKTEFPQPFLKKISTENQDAVAIDPITTDLDWTPLYDLLALESLTKVFHAGRQDIEIIYNLTGQVPKPVFDTQIAAMVCGYGESVAYLTLAADICGVKIDKTSQFMDWSHRPLTHSQIQYALNDVVYLRDIYAKLVELMRADGREEWIREEMEALIDEKNYLIDPENKWQRLKLKVQKPNNLQAAKLLCAWREREAQKRDVPKTRVLRDEIIVQIATHLPKGEKDLSKIRGFPLQSKYLVRTVIDLSEEARKTPPQECPKTEPRTSLDNDDKATFEMLKMLLRIQSSEYNVAPRLIASTEDLEILSRPEGTENKVDVPALAGWRNNIFGRYVKALKEGSLGLYLQDGALAKKEITETG